MKLRQEINDIINNLRDKGIIDFNTEMINKMSGTTDGQVYTLAVNGHPKYILKLDSQRNIDLVEQLHQTYSQSNLLPKLIHTNPTKTFMVYSYIDGVTHYHRGSKINWLTLLIEGLINHYENHLETDKWGFWLEDPCPTWRVFIDKGVEEARINVGNVLPNEDYDKVKSLVKKIPDGKKHERYLLHGDCGVHNFVFEQNTLKGVIDPSPIVGPLVYDFMYAFCSSPDDLNLETLFSAFSLLKYEPMEKSRLIEEVVIQLYCRIGICIKHHPHDLEDYLEAWNYWKEYNKWDK